MEYKPILANKLDTSDAAFSSSVRSSNACSTSAFSENGNIVKKANKTKAHYDIQKEYDLYESTIMKYEMYFC